MKHSIKVTLLILLLFFISQLVGIFVAHSYSPQVTEVFNPQTNVTLNITNYNLPYGTEPPQNIEPKSSLISIILAIFLAVLIMTLMMKFGATIFIRIWFFVVVSLALGITLNSLIKNYPNSEYIAILLALPLAFYKVFKRNIFVHNLTEILIYPGIAAIFAPLLSVWTTVALLIFASIYDIYAVWHSKFMQKLAKYQINEIKVFSGLFIPYLSSKEKSLLLKFKNSKKKLKNIKVNIAILGGGDIVFPMILSSVVLRSIGLTEAILVAIGATLALAHLFYISEKGKFYPALPFITLGCIIALLIGYFI
jgi:presenilin-like A22 family membrane protease